MRPWLLQRLRCAYARQYIPSARSYMLSMASTANLNMFGVVQARRVRDEHASRTTQQMVMCEIRSQDKMRDYQAEMLRVTLAAADVTSAKRAEEAAATTLIANRWRWKQQLRRQVARAERLELEWVANIIAVRWRRKWKLRQAQKRVELEQAAIDAENSAAELRAALVKYRTRPQKQLRAVWIEPPTSSGR
jgi:hypothetical protein